MLLFILRICIEVLNFDYFNLTILIKVKVVYITSFCINQLFKIRG